MMYDSDFTFQLKTKAMFGKGVFSQLPHVVENMGFKRTGIVIDPAVYKNKGVKKVLRDLSKKNKVTVHVYQLKGEPTYEYLDKVKGEFKKGKKSVVDCFVGIGGGSVMDFTKGLATLANNSGPSIKYRGFPTSIKPSVPVIAVPTTSGTGSEVAYNAVFVDTGAKKKLGINTENNYPVLAVLDPELTVSCPRSVTVSSGLDALVHTLESFVCVKATLASRFYAKEAFRLILNNLYKTVKDPKDIKARFNMMLGAYWAMASLSNSSSGPTGAMSYLLGATYDVPHGIAGGVFIGKITRINHDNGYYDYANLYDVIKRERVSNFSMKRRSEIVVEKIEKLIKKLNVPNHLRGFGVTVADYDLFYDHAVNIYKAAFELNPVKLSKNSIKKMLKEMIL